MNQPPPTPIKDIVQAEFSSRQAVLLQEVKEAVREALKQDQRMIVLTNQQKNEKKSRKWEVAQIVIPAVLTGLVGLFVWYAQNSLSNQINANNQAVTTRYALTQEYKKEQFKVYQRAIAKLTILESAVAGAEYGSQAKATAIAAKNNLDLELNESEFYFSPELYQELEKISFNASQLQALNPQGTGRPKELMREIETTKWKIRSEATGDIGRLPAQKP
jgi:ABC-type Na+ efflux pump permease subunit